MREPVILACKKRDIDPLEYKFRGAKEDDYKTLIKEPTVITENGRPTIVYLELHDPHEEVVEALKSIEYHTVRRTMGMKSLAALVGYLPRIAIRRDYCTASGLSMRNAEAHAVVARYAAIVGRYYQQYNTELYAKHAQMVEKVLPDWKIEESVFTSAIINKNNPILYHFDTGNFKDVWSNMLVFKRDITGGYLAVPEYDIAFELKDNSLLMFDGQSLLHGVTPFTLHSEEGYRYSVVFYSLKAMWNCLPPGEELERIKRARTKKELNRRNGILSGDMAKAAKRMGYVKDEEEVDM